MSKMKLNELRDKAYRTACGHGFHDQELSNEHFLCLVISELMEAVEADRRGKRANVDWFEKKISTSRICQGLDPDIPKERGYEVAYNETIKGSIEEELADAVIRLLDLAGLRGIALNLPTEILRTVLKIWQKPVKTKLSPNQSIPSLHFLLGMTEYLIFLQP